MDDGDNHMGRRQSLDDGAWCVVSGVGSVTWGRDCTAVENSVDGRLSAGPRGGAERVEAGRRSEEIFQDTTLNRI